MAYDVTTKVGGQPLYVWIGVGVATLYGLNYYRNKKANTLTPDPNNEATNEDLFAFQTGSSGGAGLGSLNPAGVPGVIGITAPVAKPTMQGPRILDTKTALGAGYESSLHSQAVELMRQANNKKAREKAARLKAYHKAHPNA